MKRRKTLSSARLAFAVAIGFSHATWATGETPAVPAGTLSLVQLIEFAEKNSPELMQLDESLRRAELDFANARAALFPQAAATLTHGLAKDNLSHTRSDDIWNSESKLGINWQLFKNFENISLYRQTKFKRDAAKLQRHVNREALVLKLTNAYYDLLFAQALDPVRRDQLKAYQTQQELISSLYRQGLKTEQDYARFRSAVLRAEVDYQTSEQAVTALRIELLRQLGASENLAETIEVNSPATVPDPKAITVDIQVDKNPINELIHIQDQLSKEIVAQAKRANWPQVFVTTVAEHGTRDYFSGKNFHDGKFWNFNALLTVQYNFLDWGQGSRNVDIARSLTHDAELDIRRQNIDLRASARALRTDIERYNESFRINQELNGLENRNFAQMQQQYRQGRVSYLDFIDALDKRQQARVSFLGNRFDYLKLQARVWNLEGQLYDKLTQK